MSTDDHSENPLIGEIDFKELIDGLDLCLVALGPDWTVYYANDSAKNYFKEEPSENDIFWDQLREPFSSCLEHSYKKALLGQLDQLNTSTDTPQPAPVPEIYEDVPLEFLEQKPISFEFRCAETGAAYSTVFDLHRGHFIFRNEPITDRVNAHFQAEKNREELEQALNRMTEARNANPLTGLPGNVTIQETIREYLNSDQTFALIYADLDYFKPFNDRYGFERGNEVLLFLRDLLEKHLNKLDSSLNFLGHIGGDDFVVITSVDDYRFFCENVIEEFDRNIADYYALEDRNKGGIRTENREGETQEFSIMSLSLAVVTNDDREFENYLEMTEVAANVKHLAKKDRENSCYRVDRRQENDSEKVR